MNKTAFVLLALASGLTAIHAQDYGDYPIQGVTFDRVQLTDAFWAPRIAQNQETTIPIALDQCYSTGRVLNFQKAAAILAGDNIGYFGTDYTFDDTDIYKILEGMAYSYRQSPSEALLDTMNSLIAIVAAAQEPDGYLVTARTAGNPSALHSWLGTERWEYDPNLSHELYNSGHLFEAATAHYQATGDTTLLQVAIRNADLLVEQFLDGGLAYEPGHQIVEMGLVKLYRVTDKEDYLKLAKYFLDIRGINGPNSLAYEYNQSHAAPTAQTEAVGHAVRAVYMYSGMADIAAIMGDEAYLAAINALWENMSGRKYYITGGIGALHDGEAFGDDYELPNLTAYNETCAAIGNVYWNWRMFLLTGEAKYYDIIERTLYNGVLSGISLTGDHFFYPNPLESTGGYSRSEWFGCACCPSNLCRFLASVPGYAYASRGDSLYICLYMQGKASVETSGGTVVLSQETDYPWEGTVAVRIDSVPAGGSEFTVLLRIPGWASGEPVPGDLYSYLDAGSSDVALTLNGTDMACATVDGYVAITRQWTAGDELLLTLPMDIHRVVASDQVSEDSGKVAFERGPIVYCLEWVDNDGYVFSAIIDDEAEVETAVDSTSFSSTGDTFVCLTIHGRNLVYDEDAQLAQTDYTFHAIPYFAWANRGDGSMAVWLARTAEGATANLDYVADTDTITYHIGEVPATTAGEYPYTAVTVDRAAVAEAFGISFASTAALYGTDITYAAVEPAGNLNTTSTANDPGHWFGQEGNVVSWVENISSTTNTMDIPRVYSEFDASTYTFNIGQYPQVNSTGDSIAIQQALTYVPSDGGTPARVVFRFIVHMASAKDTHAYAQAFAQQFADNSSYAHVTGEERTALETALALSPSSTTAYNSATTALYAAVTDFVNAKGDYDLDNATLLDTIDITCMDLPSASGDWTPNYYALPTEDIANALGIDQDKLSSRYGTDIILYAPCTDGSLLCTDDNAGADGWVGYWLDADGCYTEFWSGSPTFYYVFDYDEYRIGLGQNGNSPLTAGTSLTTTLSLVYSAGGGTPLRLPLAVTYRIVTQDEYTAITPLASDCDMASPTVHTLSGQRVDATHLLPGIYIVDGRKVLIR